MNDLRSRTAAAVLALSMALGGLGAVMATSVVTAGEASARPPIGVFGVGTLGVKPAVKRSSPLKPKETPAPAPKKATAPGLKST